MACFFKFIFFLSEKKNFRVYVVLPLLPGFDNINNILSVQYFNLRSIKFGETSIYNELLKYGNYKLKTITYNLNEL
jgi:hypothetical protein